MTDRRNNEDKLTPLPSQEELKRVLSYNPDTGLLLWEERPRSDFATDRSHKVWNARYAGQPALNGVGKKGYRVGRIFSIMVKSHRVIWKMVTGEEPVVIDHEDGVRTNNRWTNLLDTTDQGNAKNRKQYTNNKSGITGVYWNKACGKWHAQIAHEGRKVNLGFFTELEDAREARAKAELSMAYHPNHGRKVTL